MLLKNKKATTDDFDIIVNDTTLHLTNDMTVLGINIDSQLNFNVHVSNMRNKARRQLNVLQRLRGSLDYSSRLSIYKSFIMPNFNYCPVVWMFTSKSSLSKLESIQKRALRFVLNDYTSDYFELLDKANVPGMKIMALRYLAIEVNKCITGINPKYLNDLFTTKEHKYELRNVAITDRAKVHTTNHGLKSFKDYSAKIWNSLPNSCKSAVSLEDFKVLIKSWNGPKCSCSVCLLFTLKLQLNCLLLHITVYPKKYAHGFVVLCFVVVMQSFIMNSHEVFIHIHQGCFAGTGAIVRLPQCQWSKPDGYGKISQCITTKKHSKAKTVCIFLGVYCIYFYKSANRIKEEMKTNCVTILWLKDLYMFISCVLLYLVHVFYYCRTIPSVKLMFCWL